MFLPWALTRSFFCFYAMFPILPRWQSSAEFVERDEFGNLYILGSELLSKGNPAPSSSTVSLMKVDGDSRTKHWVVQLKGSAEKTSPPSSFSALGLVLDFNGFAVMLSREDPSHETTVRKVNRLGEELWTVVLEDSPMTFSLARGLNSVLYILQTQSQGNDTTLIELSSNGRKVKRRRRQRDTHACTFVFLPLDLPSNPCGGFELM